MLNFNFVKDEIKKIPPDDLLARGVMSLANDGKSYVCPFCGNGKGNDGDGLTPTLIDNAWIWHCFKCDVKFDNIKLLSLYYTLDNNTEFVKILQLAANDFGLSESFSCCTSITSNLNPAKSTPKIPQNEKEIALVKADIEKARANLKNFVDSQGGSWRGLSFETLDKHNCGFLNDWTPPISRANDKKRTPTPRVIIPAGVHYLARLAVPLDKFRSCFHIEKVIK